MTEYDFEQLSAYLDDELNDSERNALEARLVVDEALQRELASLRLLVQALNALPELQAPRDFTLSQTMLEPEIAQIAADASGIPPMRLLPPQTLPNDTPKVLKMPPQTNRWLSAVAAIFVVVVGAGILLTQFNLGTSPLPDNTIVANAPTELSQEQANGVTGGSSALTDVVLITPSDESQNASLADMTPTVLENMAFSASEPNNTTATGANPVIQMSVPTTLMGEPTTSGESADALFAESMPADTMPATDTDGALERDTGDSELVTESAQDLMADTGVANMSAPAISPKGNTPPPPIALWNFLAQLVVIFLQIFLG